MTQPDQVTHSQFDEDWPPRFSGTWWAGITLLFVAAFVVAAALTMAMHGRSWAPFVGASGVVIAYVAGAVRVGGLR